MRILYCNKYNFGFSGTESHLFEVMEMMRARGHDVALFSMTDSRGGPSPYERYFAPRVDFKTPRSPFVRARLGVRAIYSTAARKRIRALINDFRPDVAHVRNIYHHLSPSILWELKHQAVPVLYHMNDFKLLCPSYNFVSSSGTICEKCKGGKFWNVATSGCYAGGKAASTVLAAEAYLHRWLGTYARCVDLVLAPSRFVRQKLLENGWSHSKIEVLPHFQNLPSETTLQVRSDAPILYFGRLSQEKGVADLLMAMARLHFISLVIAGDGPQRVELESSARRFGLSNVRFAGHVSGAALDQLIADSRFTVFPSHAYETLGKSILESYAHGRAVVASDLGSRRELVDEGKTGLLYRAGDADQLAAAIKFLHERPEIAQQMGEAGRDLVRQNYPQEQHFRALTLIYQRLAERSGKAQICPPQPLRVAFIGGRGVIGKYSGVESYYEEAGKRLAARGHQITAYCRNYFTPNIATHDGMRILRLPTIRSKHLDTLLHSVVSTVHACFANYDVVNYHTLGPSLLCYVPRIFGKKTVVTVQGLDWQRKKWSVFARQCLRAGEWASAYLPNRTVVVSRTLESYYQSRYQVHTCYVPNGTFLREKRSGPALLRLGIQPDQYVLFLGRFSPEKNCGLLINAFEEIDTPMKLVLAGGSSHTDAYAEALRGSANEKIKFPGWLSGDALDEVVTNAAVFVLPSDIEGLSLALLEAMGAGVCVLVSDIPENLEVIDGAGFSFRQGDVFDLRRMLTLLLSDTRLRAAAGEKARERVRERYCWDGVADKLERIYLDLIESPQRKQVLRSVQSRVSSGVGIST